MPCPYCRAENQPGAIRCAHCTTWLTDRPPAREWSRARDGAMVAGVCRGLASRLGLPVAAVRLTFVLATIFGFWGLVVYVALWVVMPRDPLPPAWGGWTYPPAPGPAAGWPPPSPATPPPLG